MIWDKKFAEALLDARVPPDSDSLIARALRLYIKAQYGPHLEILREAWETLPPFQRVELCLDVAEKRQAAREEAAPDEDQTWINELQAEHDESEREKTAPKRKVK